MQTSRCVYAGFFNLALAFGGRDFLEEGMFYSGLVEGGVRPFWVVCKPGFQE